MSFHVVFRVEEIAAEMRGVGGALIVLDRMLLSSSDSWEWRGEEEEEEAEPKAEVNPSRAGHQSEHESESESDIGLWRGVC